MQPLQSLPLRAIARAIRRQVVPATTTRERLSSPPHNAAFHPRRRRFVKTIPFCNLLFAASRIRTLLPMTSVLHHLTAAVLPVWSQKDFTNEKAWQQYKKKLHSQLIVNPSKVKALFLEGLSLYFLQRPCTIRVDDVKRCYDKESDSTKVKIIHHARQPTALTSDGNSLCVFEFKHRILKRLFTQIHSANSLSRRNI